MNLSKHIVTADWIEKNLPIKTNPVNNAGVKTMYPK